MSGAARHGAPVAKAAGAPPPVAAPARSFAAALTRAALATSAVALLASALALLAYDLLRYHAEGREDLLAQARLIATTSVPALAFDDPQAVRDILSTLRQRQQLRLAAVYRAAGPLFAGVSPTQEPLPQRLPVAGGVFGLDRIGALSVTLPVEHGGERLGHVYLLARQPLLPRLRDTGLLLLAIMGASFAMAVAVFGRLRRRLVVPLQAVADAADGVARSADFDRRAPASGLTEVDVLVRAFNGMLSTLQREIQERRRAEAALKEDDRRKDEFLATLAHELRNPLAPIRHSAKVFGAEGATPEQRRRSAAVVERQVRHMALLLDDLLDVSRITRGKLVLRRAPTLLQDVVASAVETVRPLIEARSHALAVDLPEPSPWLEVDALRLAQVLSNLLSNAAKFTEPGGHLRLSAHVAPSGVVLAVEDDGIGIAPELLEDVFAMFGQGPDGPGSGGLGIGLALSRALVELHGGRLQALSDGPGRGTRMVITLPAALQAAPPPAGAEIAAPHGQAQGHRVLIADDNRDAADSLQALLSLEGYEVAVAYGGEEALQAYRRFAPRALLLDIGMPDLSGDQVARRIRAGGDGGVLLVALSGWGQEQDKAAALAAGFDEHLTKPVEPQRLARLLQQRLH